MTGRNVCAFFAQNSTKTNRHKLKMFLRVATALLFALAAIPLLPAQPQHDSTKPNPAIPEAKVKSRAADLLKQMTLDEKIAQLAQLPDRKSTRLNSSHRSLSRMPSSA